MTVKILGVKGLCFKKEGNGHNLKKLSLVFANSSSQYLRKFVANSNENMHAGDRV